MSSVAGQQIASDGWLSASAASRIIGCHKTSVPKLAQGGVLTVKELPGGVGRVLYLKAECETLAARIIKPATVQ